MQTLFFKFVVLSCIVFSQAFALNPPKPTKGQAGFSATKELTLGAGGYTFSFNLPAGWGIGDTSLGANGISSFQLFPINEGYGCSIEIKHYDTDDQAKQASQKIRKTFDTTKKLSDGFEVELSKAWYACRIDNKHLIQIWYSLPKKKSEHAKIWNALKSCVTIYQSAALQSSDISENKYEPITFSPGEGWFCHHPDNKLHVLFEQSTSHLWGVTCSRNTDSSASYQLKFSDRKSSGFFFVKWDQANLDTSAPYQVHLDEMLLDVKKIEPAQTVDKSPTFNLEKKYAIWRGYPYGFITIAGDGFLYGFSIKQNNEHIESDINAILKCIKWIKDK